jgi:hypothetical protein
MGLLGSLAARFARRARAGSGDEAGRAAVAAWFAEYDGGDAAVVFADEFDPRLDLDVGLMAHMDEAELRRYTRAVARLRDAAHEAAARRGRAERRGVGYAAGADPRAAFPWWPR